MARLTDEQMLHREDRRGDPRWWTAESRHGMVAAAHYRATAVGAEILGQGGNAIDAAAAVSLALGVCEPLGSGLGGMAMATIHLADENRTFCVLGPCPAPELATPEALDGADRNRGYRAVAVPTHVAVLAHLLSAYGTMDPPEVLEPAILLAEDGFILSPLHHRLTSRYRDTIAGEEAARMLLDENGEPSPVGHVLRQPALGRTLRRLAAAGLEDFYRGEIARAICADMERGGGFIRAGDLAAVRPREVEPLLAAVGDWIVHSLPPPGGGTSLIRMLLLHEALGRPDPDDPQGAVAVAEIIRRARQDRVDHFRAIRGGDPLPPDRLDRADAARAAARIRLGLGETTHLNVTDARGNWVALTQSIERVFGSGVVTPHLGFLYNGYLRAFKVKSQRHPHYLRPGAVARSNAAPTIVTRNGRPFVAIGSTGSERMSSGIFQVLARLRTQSPWEAVHSVRLHCDPQGMVLLEAKRFSPGILDALTGHATGIRRVGRYSFKVGGLQLIVREGDRFIGVGEPRRDGAASGPFPDPPRERT